MGVGFIDLRPQPVAIDNLLENAAIRAHDLDHRSVPVRDRVSTDIDVD